MINENDADEVMRQVDTTITSHRRNISGNCSVSGCPCGGVEHEQPAREGEEWLAELRERNEERKRAFTVWKERGILIESQPMPDMITDIDCLLRVAALVPGLVGTITELLNQFYPHQCHIKNGTCRRCDVLRSASQLLNTVTKEHEK